MNTKFPWANHFKIQPDKLEQIRSGLPAGGSLIHACIDAGLVNEDAYILWAKNHYKIPTLKATFFSQPPDMDFINKYRKQFPKYTLPILENEGTIFVACLEPVPDLKFAQPIQWILAPYSKLKSWAQIDISVPEVKEETHLNFVLTGNMSNGTVMAQVAPAFTAPAKPAAPPAAPATADSHKLPENPPEDIDFSKMDIPETKIEIPTATSDNPFEIKIDTNSEIETSYSVIQPLPAIEPDVPAGLNLDAIPIESPPATPNLSNLSFSGTTPKALEPLKLTEDKIVPQTHAGLPPTPPPPEVSFSDVAPKAPTMPTAPPPVFKPAAPNPPNLTAKMIKDDIAKSSVKPTPPPPPAADSDDDAPEIAHSEVAKQTLNKDAPNMAFTQMKVFFNQCMIFLFENQKLKPWKHDGSWTKTPQISDEIDLSTPSIFRIVAETKKPYHGHVIPNPINDAFFAAWNQGKYPEHITMSPLIVKNQLVGMILGGTTKDKSKSINLDTVERIAQSLASDLQSSKAA